MAVPSSLHRIMALFESALSVFVSEPDPTLIENWSVRIHEIMSARWRRFHVPEHILDLAVETRPIETLSILFHDLVYLQVDRRIHPRLQPFLAEFYWDDSYQVILPSISKESGDQSLALACHIFGFQPGQRIGLSSGINEFLSALAAARILGNCLSRWDLIQVIGCIEATIPFRPVNEIGETPSQQLKRRLDALNVEWAIGKDVAAIDQAVMSAVRVGNRDLSNFASSSVGNFLENTWKLILEGNPIFKNPMHTVSQYRNAIQKIEAFFLTLKPEIIFGLHRSQPSEKGYQEMLARAGHNLRIGAKYLQVKLYSAAILESLASLTGGDAPIVLLMGEIHRSSGEAALRMEKFLDYSIPEVSADVLEISLLNLLKDGINEASEIDLKNASLSYYLYLRLTPDQLSLAIQKSKAFFNGEVTAFEFLRTVLPHLLVSIIHAVSEIAWTRRAALSNLKRQILERVQTKAACGN